MSSPRPAPREVAERILALDLSDDDPLVRALDGPGRWWLRRLRVQRDYDARRRCGDGSVEARRRVARRFHIHERALRRCGVEESFVGHLRAPVSSGEA